MADNLPLPRAVVTKSGNLNFLEPSGPGSSLPLSLNIDWDQDNNLELSNDNCSR